MINLVASFEDIILVWLAEERAVGVCLLFCLVRLTTEMKAGIKSVLLTFHGVPLRVDVATVEEEYNNWIT